MSRGYTDLQDWFIRPTCHIRCQMSSICAQSLFYVFRMSCDFSQMRITRTFGCSHFAARHKSSVQIFTSQKWTYAMNIAGYGLKNVAQCTTVDKSITSICKHVHGRMNMRRLNSDSCDEMNWVFTTSELNRVTAPAIYKLLYNGKATMQSLWLWENENICC